MSLFAILMVMCLISALFTIMLVVGEALATKKPNTHFAKWWRRNMIGIES